jgi:hypothetical protein
MKILFFILLSIFFSIVSYSQTSFDSKYHLLVSLNEESSIGTGEYYENLNNGLVQTFILEFKDKNQKQLVKDFKNWYSSYFVSLKTTLQSETEDQMVFNYIYTSYFKQGLFQINSSHNHNLRLIVQFKDYKIRVQFFGDLSFINYGGQSDVIVNPTNKYYFKGIKYQLYINESKHMSEILTELNNSLTKPSTDNW